MNWTNLTIVKDGKAKVYINGKLQKRLPRKLKKKYKQYRLIKGLDYPRVLTWFNENFITDVKCWNKYLTPEEIMSNYNSMKEEYGCKFIN